jgi:nucleoside 2-deoxyribosyltransferase
MKLYLAGPLFTWGEKWQNAQLATELRLLGHEPFVPQEQETGHTDAASIFRALVEGMDWSEAIVACIDGPDPDSGTSWELGYCYAKGKPAILYRTDFRTASGDFDGQVVNLMLSVPAHCKLVEPASNPALLAGIIDRAIKDLPG